MPTDPKALALRAGAILLLASVAFPNAAEAQLRSILDPFGLFSRDEEPDEAIVDPVNYTVSLQVSPPVDDLEDTLRSASILVADENEPVSGSLGLLSRARTDRQRLVAALFENSRYGGLVTIRIEGRDIADLAPDTAFDTSRPVPVSILVQPGPAFSIGRVALSTDDGQRIDPAQYELTPGSPADSVRILAAENQIFRDQRETGRPFVAVTGRDVVADHNTNTVDYALELSPGDPVPFGQTFVTGTRAVRPGFVAYMTGIQPGTIYSPEDIDRARERLTNLAVFSSVNVKIADAQEPDGTVPVLVEVAERPFNTLGAGATLSNTDGAGVNAYYERRNLFGQAESIRLEGAVSRIGANEVSSNGRDIEGIDYRASATFRKPGVLGPDSVYIGSLGVLREQPLAYDRFSIFGTSGVEYRIDRVQSVIAGLRLEYEEITDFLGTDDFLIASAPVTYTYDTRDDALNPTEGFRVQLLGEPSFDANNSTFFFKARGDASAYLSFDEDNRFILAGRAGLGTIVGADLLDMPNSRRFYAGGGGSVRGYVFQSIGPYFPSVADTALGQNPLFVDTPTGGLSVFEASAELRIGITENIQIVPFIDGGAVSDDLFPDFSEFRLGAGVGARYITGFGPIRVDVGIPLDPGPRDGSFQFYAGIGQAF